MSGKNKMPEATKKLINLVFSTLAVITVYLTGRYFRGTELSAVSVVIDVLLYASIPVLILVFGIVNKGFSTDIPKKSQLKDSMTDDEKEEFIEELKVARAKAKPILYFMLPVLLIAGADLILTLIFNV